MRACSGPAWDEKQLAALTFVTRPASEIADLDEASEWVGMPEYTKPFKQIKVVVNIETPEQCAEFMRLIGAPDAKAKHESGKTYSRWWPHREKEDVSSVRFEDANQADA